MGYLVRSCRKSLANNPYARAIGGATLVVGLRLHSLVFASIQGTPCASIDYDIKIRGYMEHMQIQEYLSETTKGLDSLLKISEKTLQERDEYSGTRARVRSLRRTIEYEADRITSVLTERRSQSKRI